MNQCICGKSYRHHTNLRRHQRGNVKQGLVPCSAYVATLITQTQVSAPQAEADNLLKRFEALDAAFKKSIEVPKPLNHTPNLIPEFAENICKERFREEFSRDSSVSFLKLISNQMGVHQLGGKLCRIIVHGFKTINMNKEHPELWNVCMWNVSSKNIYVFTNGDWEAQMFSEWVNFFSTRFFGKLTSITEGMDTWLECCQVCFEAIAHNQKDIEDGLKTAIMHPTLRTMIKARYSMRG